MAVAVRLGVNGHATEVPLEVVGTEVLDGGIFVVEGCLRASGHLKRIADTTLDIVAKLVGAEKARTIRERGFEATHHVLDAEEVMRVADAVQRRLERDVPDILRELVPRVLGHASDFFYELHPNVRFHVPYDAWRPQQAAYEAYARAHGEGKVSPHDPHRDAWYRCPQNAINLWGAIGSVEPGNGMSLYPDVYRRRIQRGTSGKVAHLQQLGHRVNFDLAPGDVLVFHGNHLHSSELNRTPHTRYVVSFRLTLTRPSVGVASNHRYRWSRLDRGMLGAAVGLAERAVRNIAAYLAPPPVETLPALPMPPDLSVTADKEMFTFPVSSLVTGSIVPLPRGLCATRVDGQVAVFLRTCPHAAGDFAMGSTDGKVVACPEHNLTFDLKTGRSACRSLADLRFVETEEVGDEIRVYPRRRRSTPSASSDAEPTVAGSA